jgi:predicted SAM-dependent methyltransferase
MIKLNIGCGNVDFGEDWDHIDAIYLPHILYHDVTRLPYADGAVDMIYSSHLLEYFDRDEAINVLKEWCRVLKVGGKIYLSVPDFRTMAELYVKENKPLHKFLGPLYGKMDSDGKIIYHKTVWDYSSLGEYLRIAGFRRIDEWHPNNFQSNVLGKDYDDCSRAEVDFTLLSLNIEATKNEYEGKK